MFGTMYVLYVIASRRGYCVFSKRLLSGVVFYRQTTFSMVKSTERETKERRQQTSSAARVNVEVKSMTRQIQKPYHQTLLTLLGSDRRVVCYGRRDSSS